MKTTTASGRTRSARTDATRRAQWLADFDRSGLSAAAFAREHGLNYTTFCGRRLRLHVSGKGAAPLTVSRTNEG